MVSFTPVQWLQTIISNCMQMISIENDRKLSAINPKDLKKIYESYSECIFRKNRALAPHERSAVPLGTDHCPVG